MFSAVSLQRRMSSEVEDEASKDNWLPPSPPPTATGAPAKFSQASPCVIKVVGVGGGGGNAVNRMVETQILDEQADRESSEKI